MSLNNRGVFLANTQAPSYSKVRLERESQEEPEDDWINDVGPLFPAENSEGEAVTQPQLEALRRPLQSPLPSQTHNVPTRLEEEKEDSSHGASLWSVIYPLSERISHELNQKSEKASMSEQLLAGFVRKRTLDILRTDTTLAGKVHGLDDAKLVLQRVLDEVLGCGPLEPLLRDTTISRIMVVGPQPIYIERDGKVQEDLCHFEDGSHVLRIIENMLRQAGVHKGLDSRAIADIRLPNGSLVNVVIPPLAVNGPTITIRKHADKSLSIGDLIQSETMTDEMSHFLQACVQARLNIVICGGMGSGRTTLLNALCMHIPVYERIVTIEDTAELQLDQKQVISLVPQTGASNGGMTMRDLVTSALHMHPQRLILGECRGDEIVEMLQAMYTGHDGTLMSVYAHNPHDCLSRLEMMCLWGGKQMPAAVLRSHLARALDVIIQVSRLHDGSHKIMNIVEVQNTDSDTIKLQNIFRYQETGTDKQTGKVQGTFELSGFQPKFTAKLEAMGIRVPVPGETVKLRRVVLQKGG